VEIPGLNPVSLPPVCLLYSPEFAPEQAGRGRVTLEKLSATTTGEARVDLPGIWKSLPSKPQFVDLAVWLVIFALLIYLLEIFERRTGWLGARRRRGDESLTEEPKQSERLPTSSPTKTKPSAFEQIAWRRQKSKPKADAQQRVPTASGGADVPVGQSAPPAADSAGPTSQLDALRLARKRAQDRRGKE
jgi:hypothetical protein